MKKPLYFLLPLLLALVLSCSFLVSAIETVSIKINFQPGSVETPAGCLADTGKVISSQSGYVYGWNKDHTDVARERKAGQNRLFDTLIHIHSGGIWEIELSEGDYDVTVSIGDYSFSSVHTINIENISYWQNITLNPGQFLQTTKRVRVVDGRLTLDAGTSPEKQTRINYIEIKAANVSDNQAPVVEAGADQWFFIPQTTIEINGIATDDNLPVSSQLSYKWELISGPTGAKANIENPDNGKTKVTFSTPGSYILGLSVSDGEKTASDTVTITVIDPEKPLSINFQPKDAAIPSGFIPDYGEILGVHNGYAYGWKTDHSGVVRKRNAADDQSLDTVCHFLNGGMWEIALPYGQYEVTVSVGDAFPSKYTINAEGFSYWIDLELTAGQYRQLTKTVTVSDGFLTVDAGQSELKATRINHIKIAKPGVNKAPLAEAGVDQAIFWPEKSVKITGVVSDDNLPASNNLMVSWEKVSGSGEVSFSDVSKPETTAEFSSPGTYILSLLANDGEKTTNDTITVTVIDSGKPVQINFQPKEAITPAGYLPDWGGTYSGKNGQVYGWNKDHTVLTRERAQNDDQRLDTVCHLNSDSVWEIALKDGDYEITVSVGDTYESTYTLEAEGLTLFNSLIIPANQHITKKEKIHVADGKLTLSAAKAPDMAVRINYLEIASLSPDVNKKPVVSAGKEQGLLLPKNALILQGSVTDDSLPENITTKWDVLNGPGAVVFENLQASITKASFGRPGTYTLQLSANDGEYITKDTVEITVFDSLQPLRINFQPTDAVVPSGYLPDSGKGFNYQNGFNYGWNQEHISMIRKRNSNSDLRLDTVCHFLNGGEWSIAVPNGIYEVTVGIGDSFENTVTLNVEGINYWNQLQLEPGKYLNVKKQVKVEDNRLTLSSINAANMDARTRLDYLEINVILDTESPLVTGFTLSTNPFTNSREVLFSANGSDNISIDGWFITLDPEQPDYQTPGWIVQQPDSYILPQVSGVYNLYLWVMDRQGNVSNLFEPITVELDCDPPVVTGGLISPAVTNNQLVELAVEATENKEVAGWFCTLTEQASAVNDPGWLTVKPVNYELPDVSDQYTLFIWAKDKAGNIGAPLPLEVELDKTLPVINIFRTESEITNNRVVPIIIDAFDNTGIAGWQVGSTAFIGNQVILTPSDKWLTSTPTEVTLPDGDGIYQLFLWINDKAGNGTHTTCYVTLDRVSPEAPQVTGTTLTNNYTPTWNWNIPADAVSIRYRLDSGEWVDIGGIGITSYTPATNLGDGEHKFEVQARDNAGNWSESGSFTIEVDTIPPAGPQVTGTTSATAAAWKWTIPVDAVNIRYRLDGGDWVITGDTKVTSYTPANYISSGKHTLEVQAADAIGNWSNSGSYTVEKIPNFGMYGFTNLNGGVTGGLGGFSITINNGTNLQAYLNLNGPMNVYIRGKITPENLNGLTEIIINNNTNVSIIGVGNDAELNGVCLKIKGCVNIMIRNLKIHNENGPGISLEGPVANVWIDHCEFSNNYTGAIETDPGLINIKGNCEYMGMSWNYFHDCGKAVIVGADNTDNYDRKLTFQHNYLKNCRYEALDYHYGTGHVYENYFFNLPTCGINSAMGARLLIEKNWFETVTDPIQSMDSSITGLWDVKKNMFINCIGNQPETSSCIFMPIYTYSPSTIPVEDVKNSVTHYAGVGIVN